MNRPSAHGISTLVYQMSAPDWQIAFPTGNWMATHRGIRIVIILGEMGNPFGINWFIGGREVQSLQINCHLELAKRLGVNLVDDRIPVDEEWQQAEKKDSGFDLGDASGTQGS